ncbi:MAG TPA: tRNA lysidine(34) synthetase TilS, partial [Verrucomicrobiota bacterium]|nr:tRNA lysidine(34) synthetase TilS [Verrucomicrobiota bacterium]
MTDLLAEVRTAILTRRLFERGERIVVAVSGGLDSMVLLQLLDELASDSGWSLIVAHFNHGLRGWEADRDEALVRDSAWRLGWPCAVGWADSALRKRQPGISIEMAARQARHRFLAEVAAQSGCSKVALGQHADDQIETVLLRLLRGAGGEGLAGIKWLGPSPANPMIQLVRPLLGQTRATLRQWAGHADVSWREDRTNACADMSRN